MLAVEVALPVQPLISAIPIRPASIGMIALGLDMTDSF
jgi:hypothetical protein